MEFARACARVRMRARARMVGLGALGGWMEGASESQGLKDRGCRIAPSVSRHRCWACAGRRRCPRHPVRPRPSPPRPPPQLPAAVRPAGVLP